MSDNPKPIGTRPRRTRLVLRLSADQKELLEAAAERRGMKLTNWCLRVLEREAQREITGSHTVR